MPITVISNKATTQIVSKSGYLQSIIISSAGTSWTLQVNDSGNQTFTGPTILGATPITVPAVGTNLLPAPVFFSNGLQVVTAGTTAGELEFIWY